MTAKSNILGIDIDKLSKDQFIQIVKERLDKNMTTKIFTPNTDILLKAKKDDLLRITLLSADILLADGAGLIIASKILGDPLPERLAGIEMAENIFSLAALKGLKIFLLGGDIGVAEAARRNIEDRFSGIKICGTHHGYFGVNTNENEKILKKINNASPDILFVCMGFPRQEKWICENCTKLPSVKITMGLGGSLDVWAKRIRRAPKFLQILYLEWLWRIIREPKRIGFLTKIPLFFIEIWRQKMSHFRNQAEN